MKRLFSKIIVTLAFIASLASGLSAAEQGAFREKAWKFLCDYMPAHDRGKVSEAYLRENLDLALAVRNYNDWARTIPEDIFLNDVLPYSSVGEDVEAWRPVFYEQFLPLVAHCKSATQVVETLNGELWKRLSVVYSPKRDKPDQAPFHSMRIGMASCTGLSILLIDACRAVGVPARFAGCRWKNKPGNHSWVEFWDGGKWHYIGAFDCPKADESWFDPDAACSVEDDPYYAIYASSWAPTGTEFSASWRNPAEKRAVIPAYNVTARYLGKKKVAAEKQCSLSLNLRDASGKRVAVPVVVREKASGRILASGTTHDDRRDLNNHFTLLAKEGTAVEIYVRPQEKAAEILLGEYVFEDVAKTLNLSLPKL